VAIVKKIKRLGVAGAVQFQKLLGLGGVPLDGSVERKALAVHLA
jgi:hypothetical protein